MLRCLTHTGRQFGVILNTTYHSAASEEAANSMKAMKAMNAVKNLKAMKTLITYFNEQAAASKTANLEGRVSPGYGESHFRFMAEKLEVEEYRLRREHPELSKDRVISLQSEICEK